MARADRPPQEEESQLMKFRVFIEQDEDSVFVAECPTLPGCISQGRTREDAKRNIKEAIEAYLQVAEPERPPEFIGVQQLRIKLHPQ